MGWADADQAGFAPWPKDGLPCPWDTILSHWTRSEHPHLRFASVNRVELGKGHSLSQLPLILGGGE